MEKNKVIFVLGGPGSGKSTLCNRLEQELDYEHIKTGDFLRNIVKEQKHPKWKELKYELDNGLPVPSKDYFGPLKNAVLNCKKKVMLVDGFPREFENQESWDEIIGDKVDVVGLLYCECSNEKMLNRIMGRNEHRSDDSKDIAQKRINDFFGETLDIIKEYEKKGKLIKVNSNQDKDELFKEAVNKIKDFLSK